jgi:2-polyprenyl-3-methyl-5-hydroxy-6-metoxy-1,4-benzoquinol methylase
MTHDADQTQRRVAAFFDREAARFPNVNERDAPWVRRLTNALFRRSLRLRFERVMSECVNLEGRRVLDIGCGPGTYSIALAQAGAKSVVGIDVAPGMIEIARKGAAQAGVDGQCEFHFTGLDDYQSEAAFDYVIAMGIMDYVERADLFVQKALSLAGGKAFFSFPKRGGILAWQRRLRYRQKCPLFMYSREDLENLLGSVRDFNWTIESIARDWLVIAQKNTRP